MDTKTILIKGDKVANLDKLNQQEKKLVEFIKSISTVGHRESYNSLLRKFAKVEKVDSNEFVKVRNLFSPSRIHALCFAIASASEKSSIIPYCSEFDSMGNITIIFDKFSKIKFDDCYTKSDNKKSVYNPVSMILGLLQNEKYKDCFTDDVLNSIESVIESLRQ